ncbi:MAG: Rid family hydrolase [Gammaproteobacteria bacterium]
MLKKVLAISIAALFAATVYAADSPPAQAVAQKPDARPAAPFSKSILADDTLYVSGHIAADAATGQAPVDIEVETHQVLDDVKHTVEQAGLTMDDLVAVTVYCTDLELYDKFNAIYRGYFHGQFPTRAFIGVNKLLRGAHFEVSGVAVKPLRARKL